MKYLVIIGIFFLHSSLAGANDSKHSENCSYATQGSNEGSEWNRLLAQLTRKNTKDKEKRTRRGRSKPGQR